MKEVKCLIKETISIRDNFFYLVEELATKEEHFVPLEQINTFGDINLLSTYDFIKDVNTINNKAYLSIINPKFSIGNEHLFNIVDIKEDKTGLRFILESDYRISLTVKAFSWQKDYKKVKCRVIGYKKGLPVLRNVDNANPNWEVNGVKTFKIINYGQQENKKGNKFDTVILDVDGVHLHIRAYAWHKPHIWVYKDLKCKIIGLSNSGLPKLIIEDDRHPHYELNKIYDFEILGFSLRDSQKGKIKIINLIDKYDCTYEVLALPNQENKLKSGDTISCKIENIGSNLHLRQVNFDDPFFFSFEEIIKDKYLKKQYFDNYVWTENEPNKKIVEQYESKSAFWIFTYCAIIIPKIKSDLASRKEYKKLLELVNIHKTIETWIVSSGILRAINDDFERKQAKNKIEIILENNDAEIEALNTIINFKIDAFLESQCSSPNYKSLYYLFRYGGLEIINEFKVLEIIEANNNQSYLKQISLIIKNSKLQYKNNIKSDYFILSNNNRLFNEENFKKYFNWSIIELFIYNKIGAIKEENLLISQVYRHFSSFEKNYETRKKLLFNAFHILSNYNISHLIPITVNTCDFSLDIEKLSFNPNFVENTRALIPGNDYTAKVEEKHYQGFKLTTNNVAGFIPPQNIVDQSLKYYSSTSLNWDVSVEITLYSQEFNYFIAKQIPEDSDRYLSRNLEIGSLPKVGDVIYATVKNTMYYGVFFSSQYGDGLLRIQNISNYFDEELLNICFRKGDKIPVYILALDNNKLELGFKQLIGTEYESQYFDIINSDFNFPYEEDDNIDVNYNFELEKGFVFEQFAIIQNDINDKIKYLKFSKAFFSNTKNARSYLLNIYIDYFESLIKLDDILKNYSYLKYEMLKTDILQIKDKVQPKTLENFPESKNLLFFIDILRLFNSNREKDIETLYSLLSTIDKTDSLQKVVTKIVLSNNLIISESDIYNTEEIDNYTLKNLKRLRTYITHGVLSLEDAIEDRVGRELAEKRIYWRRLIELDEGEKLEFKSTFLTPIPNEEKLKIIANIERQIAETENAKIIESLTKKIDEIKGLTARKRIIHSALKSIAAFTNTNGGTLLLGVSDDKKIFGLEQDYASFKKGNNRDEFGKFFDDAIKNYFGNSFSSLLLEKEFLKFPEGDVLVITVKRSHEEIFLLKDEDGKASEQLYVRNLSSSEKLEGTELAKFIKKKYWNQLIKNIEIEE